MNAGTASGLIEKASYLRNQALFATDSLSLIKLRSSRWRESSQTDRNGSRLLDRTARFTSCAVRAFSGVGSFGCLREKLLAETGFS